ncbi:MAG: beta-ketoacyl synthase chain length factor, partial [Hydrogenophaga sp.]|nr:beta-ketoacyl synthase chain length factor [Hydrogenophaga sp.]
FGAGLLDALAQVAVDGQPVLLVAYDSEYPEPLRAKRDTPDCAGVAMLLTPSPSGALGQLTVAPTTDAAEALADASLDALRQAIPAMRALPLLRHMARGQAGEAVLDYLAPMQLRAAWTPC